MTTKKIDQGHFATINGQKQWIVMRGQNISNPVLLVAVRYRSLVLLMHLFVFLEWSSWLALGLFKTIETAGTAPAGVLQLVLVVVVPVLFCLSIWRPSAE